MTTVTMFYKIEKNINISKHHIDLTLTILRYLIHESYNNIVINKNTKKTFSRNMKTNVSFPHVYFLTPPQIDRLLLRPITKKVM